MSLHAPFTLFNRVVCLCVYAVTPSNIFICFTLLKNIRVRITLFLLLYLGFCFFHVIWRENCPFLKIILKYRGFCIIRTLIVLSIDTSSYTYFFCRMLILQYYTSDSKYGPWWENIKHCQLVRSSHRNLLPPPRLCNRWCLSVWLFICEQCNSKTYWWIFFTFSPIVHICWSKSWFWRCKCHCWLF